MRVRFIRSWQAYKPGQEFDNFADGMANILIKRGIIIDISREDAPKKKTRKENMIPPISQHA